MATKTGAATNQMKGKLTPGSSNVRHLVLHDNASSSGELEKMLELPNGLEIFEYEYGAGLSESEYNPKAIHRGLLSQDEALEGSPWLPMMILKDLRRTTRFLVL